MNKFKLISDLLTAFGAQGISFVCSVITTLLIPKVLGVEEFAYWQLFIFYATYVSFFQLGLNDGVYLQHGGETIDKIDKGLIRSELRVGMCYQLVAAVLIALYGLFFEQDSGRVIVIVAAAIYLLLSNVTFYISYVFQAMNETKVASFSTMVNRGAYLIPLVACILLRVQDFHVYVIFYLLSQGLALAYCLYKGRAFLDARPWRFRQAVCETLRSMRLGIVLTVSNITGMLLIGSARLVIDALWGLNAFGEVSLSLSIVNFAMAFISQAAMVLFPALRVAGEESERACYGRLRNGLAALLPFAMLLYAPLRGVVGLWLPQYAESLVYLALLFPVCLFEILSNLTISTFLKVRCEPKKLLWVNLVAFAVTLMAQLAAVKLFGTPAAVVFASLLGIAIRFVIGTVYLGKIYNSNGSKAIFTLLFEATFFYGGRVVSAATDLLWCLRGDFDAPRDRISRGNGVNAAEG